MTIKEKQDLKIRHLKDEIKQVKNRMKYILDLVFYVKKNYPNDLREVLGILEQDMRGKYGYEYKELDRSQLAKFMFGDF